MVGWRRSWPPSLCHPHPWGPGRNRGGTNCVDLIPNCEAAAPPNIGVPCFTRFPRSARSGLVLPLVLLEAFSTFSAFSAFRSVLERYPRYARSPTLRHNVLAGMVSGNPKMALL